MKSRALICVFLFLLSLSAFGQDQRPEWSSPNSLVTALKTGTHDKQAAFAKQLGIERFDPQHGFDDCEIIRADAAWLDERRETSVLRVQCGYDLNLVVLGKEKDDSWARIDSMYLYAAYDKLTLEYASLIHAPLQELVIHNAAAVSGNLYEAYFLVIRLLDGKLTVVFSSLETAQEPHLYDGAPRSQSSTITLKPAAGNESGEIKQISQVEVGQRPYTIRRDFSWDPEVHAFVEEGVGTIEPHRAARSHRPYRQR